MVELINMMIMSEGLMIKHSPLRQCAHSQFPRNRALILKTLPTQAKEYFPHSGHAQVRDLAVQIFDSFIANSIEENPKILMDTKYLQDLAKSSFLLSSKMQDQGVLDWSSYSEDQKEFEHHLLHKINFSVVPHATPSVFMDILFEIPHNFQAAHSIKKTAEDVVGIFICGE